MSPRGLEIRTGSGLRLTAGGRHVEDCFWTCKARTIAVEWLRLVKGCWATDCRGAVDIDGLAGFGGFGSHVRLNGFGQDG